MEAKEKAIEMLQVKQCIKEVQAKINYCVQLKEQNGDESFDYWNDVMKELLVIAEFLHKPRA